MNKGKRKGSEHNSSEPFGAASTLLATGLQDGVGVDGLFSEDRNVFVIRVVDHRYVSK